MPLLQTILPTPRPLDTVGGFSTCPGGSGSVCRAGGHLLLLDMASPSEIPVSGCRLFLALSPFTCPPGPSSQNANLISSHHSAPLRGLPWALETPGTKARVLPRSISPTVLQFGPGPSCLWSVTSTRSSPTTCLRDACLHPQGHHGASQQSCHWGTLCALALLCLTW